MPGHLRRFLPMVCLAAAAPGCSPSDVPLAEVTGQVTFNGRPAPAEIFFQPRNEQGQLAGRPSTAQAGDDGTFRVSFTADRYGAVIGPHRISVKVLRPGDGPAPRSYREAVTPLKTVYLQRDVHPGHNRFQFAITY